MSKDPWRWFQTTGLKTVARRRRKRLVQSQFRPQSRALPARAVGRCHADGHHAYADLVRALTDEIRQQTKQTGWLQAQAQAKLKLQATTSRNDRSQRN